MKNEITVSKIINYLTVKEKEYHDIARDDLSDMTTFMKWIVTGDLLRLISNEELFNKIYNETMDI